MQVHNEILTKLTQIIRANLSNPALPVTPETSPDQIEGWDSMKMVDIILDAEDLFGIRLSPEEIERLRCVGDLAMTIERKAA